MIDYKYLALGCFTLYAGLYLFISEIREWKGKDSLERMTSIRRIVMGAFAIIVGIVVILNLGNIE